MLIQLAPDTVEHTWSANKMEVNGHPLLSKNTSESYNNPSSTTLLTKDAQNSLTGDRNPFRDRGEQQEHYCNKNW